MNALDVAAVGGGPVHRADESSCSATSGATDTTSSAGPPAPPSSTSRRLLRIGSPLFHFGILIVLLGHVAGLVVPKSWTEARRHRRGGVPPARRRPRHRGRVLHGGGPGHPDLPPAHGRPGVHRDHPQRQAHVRRARRHHPARPVRHGRREPRRRRVRLPRPRSRPGSAASSTSPQRELMADAPLLFQLHALSALVLFAIWPFTRLVHMLTAPRRLPHPAVHRLPQPRRPAWHPRTPPRLGTVPLTAHPTPARAAPYAGTGGPGGRAPAPANVISPGRLGPLRGGRATSVSGVNAELSYPRTTMPRRCETFALPIGRRKGGPVDLSG